MVTVITLRAAFLVLFLTAPGFALAQGSRAPPPAAISEQPERITAQFGDWVLVCLGQPSQRQCEVVHSMHDNQRRTIAVLAFGRTQRDQPLRIVLVVPVNLSIGVPVKLAVDNGEPLTLLFRRCLASTCSAELELRDDALQRRIQARSSETPAIATWQDAAGAEASATLSLRGLLPALEALAREGW